MDVQKELERFQADAIYLDKHRTELTERYPEQWVAVYNLQVVGAAEDLDQLIEDLKCKGIPPGDVYQEFLSRTHLPLIV